MATQVEIIAELMDSWIVATQRKINKIQTDEDYYRSSTELLDIAGSFIVLLEGFGDIIDEDCIDACIYRLMTILSMIKYHMSSRKLFEEAPEKACKDRLSDISKIRTKSLEEIIYIIRLHNLPNIY
jgi:hypothetical protein